MAVRPLPVPPADGQVLGALQRITDASLAYLPHDRLLEELIARVCEILAADTAALLLLDESRPLLRARAARGIEEEVERGVVVPLGAGFAGRVAAERRTIAIEDLDQAELVNPLLRERGIRSLLGVPLLVEGRLLGVMHVGSLTPRRFTPAERDLLQLVADRAALAIEHAALVEQQRLAEALQRHLLPQDLHAVPGLEVATRYLPASRDRVGGDWYDAFEVTPGEIVVAVGDVVGHGLAAAAVMAQLRTALRAYAVEGHPEAEVVERVNRLMCELGPDATTTLVYTVIETQAQRLRVVNAGHPPPLIVDPDGRAELLPVQGGIPLGASPLASYRSDVHPFPTGSTVLLYTDGLVETRTEPLDHGLERLRATAPGAGGIETMCTRIVRRLAGEDRADDVALIAARVPPLANPLTTRWPTDSHVLADVRQMLRRWLRERGVGEADAYDIVVACGEACANAIEHAYRPGRHSFEVHAVEQDGRVRVEVRDRGRWREARGVNRGRGLPMMRALMHSVVVEDAEDGTRVVLERDLSRPAPVGPG